MNKRLIVSVLPSGPTAFFKVSNVVPSEEVFNHGKVTAHQPEIILNNFNTRLGHRVGRFLGSFFPHVRGVGGGYGRGVLYRKQDIFILALRCFQVLVSTHKLVY